MYASVVAQKCPNRVRELWAYQTMVVHEARRCGGKVWQIYDSMFRQQVANNPKVDWSVLNTSLYSTSFLAMQNQRGRACQHCMETDHASQVCALAPTLTSKTGQAQENTENKEGSPGKNGEPASIGTRGSAICHTVASSMCVPSVEAITSAGGPSQRTHLPRGDCGGWVETLLLRDNQLRTISVHMVTCCWYGVLVAVI